MKCVVCNRLIKQNQMTLENNAFEGHFSCKRCRKIDEVLILSDPNSKYSKMEYMTIPIKMYNEIRDELRKQKIKLPNVLSTRIIQLDRYSSQLENMLKLYREKYLNQDDAADIKRLTERQEEIEDEIASLQEDAGDIEREIKNFPLSKVR